MCSQPMVQAAQEFRATRRAAFSSSPERLAAPSNGPCWKLRVGSAARRLKVKRLATVPSSRHFAFVDHQNRRLGAGPEKHQGIEARLLRRQREVGRRQGIVESIGERRLGEYGKLRRSRQRRADQRAQRENQRSAGAKRTNERR